MILSLKIWSASLKDCRDKHFLKDHPVELAERLVPDWQPDSGTYFCNTYALPVAIGDGTVIGAGSVVTKNIPANCVAAGNPCRIIRQINEGAAYESIISGKR